MALLQMKVSENGFTPAQKKEIVAKLTDAVMSSEGERAGTSTMLAIEEVDGEYVAAEECAATKAERLAVAAFFAGGCF
jgi:4-oxalocrotonate tautomerase